MEHRPLTISFLHLVLSWASLPKVFHVWPQLFTSASTSRLQVFLGRPRFRFPWVFYFRACHVTLSRCFLKVWPIHLHLRRLICLWMASWLACFQRSSFVIPSGSRKNLEYFMVLLVPRFLIKFYGSYQRFSLEKIAAETNCRIACNTPFY